MNVASLDPPPAGRALFKRDKLRFVPNASGCYALTTFEGEILYVGLSVSLRNRVEQHLGNPQKRAPTGYGRAFFVHWIEREDIERVERTWLNSHIAVEGRMPVLNNVFSPTST